jgi:hypothetical protein
VVLVDLLDEWEEALTGLARGDGHAVEPSSTSTR